MINVEDQPEVTVTDAQTQEEGKNNENLLYGYDPQIEIDIQEDKWSVFQYMRKYDQASLKAYI